MSTPFSQRCADAEIAAREQGFTGFAHALRVVQVAEQYGLTCDDAEAFVQDQAEFERMECERSTALWSARNEQQRQVEARKEPPV